MVKLIPMNILNMDIKYIIKNLIMKINSKRNRVEP